jgi:DNA (cytosine-5)-methyltransferase 1
VTTGVSLFAGVGGFDLAMQRVGIDVKATVEIDRAANTVLAKRFPDSQHFNDIKEVSGEQLRDAGFISNRGVLTGGFPCQDLSVAGYRAGLAGRRSGLFWEIVRLLDELSPEWFVLENVPGLLSSNEGRDFGTVLGALVQRGYGVAYRILDSQYFRVPQRRRRVFIVGHLGDDGRASCEVLALTESLSRNSAAGQTARQEVAGTLGRGSGDRGWRGDLDSMGAYVKVVRSGARNEDGELPADVWREERVTPTLNQFDSGEVRATTLVFSDRGHSGEIAPTLKVGGGPIMSGVRRLTPLEYERLQGFPDGWTEGQPDSARYKQMGNAVTVPVVEWVIKRLVATA